MKLKVLCLLQNAWGSAVTPMVFIPNPRNKSAKTLQKILPEAKIYFCNTTRRGTATAAGRLPVDPDHMDKLMRHIIQTRRYKCLVVCGKQALNAIDIYVGDLGMAGIPVFYTKHPAARDLSNVECDQYRATIMNNIN